MSATAAISRVEITGPGRNLLNPEVMAKLEAGLRAAGEDPNTSGIILTGVGLSLIHISEPTRPY